MDQTLLEQLLQNLREVYDASASPNVLHQNTGEIWMDADTIFPPMAEYIDVFELNDTITWKLNLPDDFDHGTSVTSGSRDYPSHQKYKIRHEFVGEALGNQATDVKLSSVFPIENDECDNMTPDFVIADEDGTVHVIELTTSRSEIMTNIIRSLKVKQYKYEIALTLRSKHVPITLTAIVVTERGVLSNVDLPQALVNELVFRMQIAVALEWVALSKHINLSQVSEEDPMSQRSLEMSSVLEKIPYLFKTKSDLLGIDKEYYEDILEPTDKEIVTQEFCTSMRIARESMREPVSEEDTIDKYWDSIEDDPMKVRLDMKPIINFPLWSPKVTSPSSLPPFLRVISKSTYSEVIKLWDCALSQTKEDWREENVNLLLNEALEEDPKIVKEMENNRKKLRSKYRRVDLSSVLTTSVKKVLAEDGLFGKKYKDELNVKSKRLHQKKSFHVDTNLADVSWFLNNEDWLSLIPGESIGEKNVNDLIYQSESLIGNDKWKLDTVREWRQTKLHRWLDMISDVAMELCVSINQNCTSNEFILKKLRNYNVLLLIKPTNSRSHMYVSLAANALDCEVFSMKVPGRNYIQLGNWYFTDFVSFRADKLENLSTASSSLFSLVSYWSYHHNLEGFSVEEFRANPSCLRMLLLTLMVKLEDKSCTEETITNTRYIYMELFKSGCSFSDPRPSKVFSKLTTNPRSRLSLFLIKNICMVTKQLIKTPPRRILEEGNLNLEEGEDAKPGDRWEGFVNLLTGDAVTTASQIVNLMYIGYFKNKNEVAQGNSDWLLVEKVLEEECGIDFNRRNELRGVIPPGSIPKKKEFSSCSIKYGCDIMETNLRSKYGAEWKEAISQQILEDLSRQLSHEISTLKASSLVSHKGTRREACSPKSEELHRTKVIQAIATRLNEFGLNPLLNIEKIVSSIENSSEGVISDLFKKNQHGGLREIYVLTIESRMVQLFIETVSRTICNQFPEETLTHPYNKMALLDQHKIRSSKYAQSKSVMFGDLCSSSDKTRWNQNFSMRAMIIPLLRLTPEVYHPIIIRIMNLWANKLIKLPPNVCNLLMQRVELSSEPYKELLHQFWKNSSDKSRKFVPNAQSPFINITSGMMQGILHYTSSLLHLTFLKAGSSMVRKFMNSTCKGVKLHLTQVCSSDDSATILTIFGPKSGDPLSKRDLLPFICAESCLIALTEFCKYFCMIESKKSTIGLYDYIEFNSEFLFKNTLAHPIIKFIAASLTLTESEDFYKRFHTQYNLLSELNANGFPSRNSSLCQVSQLILHYKTMGSSMNPLFPKFTENLLEFPHPRYGFFLLDSEYCCGLMGWSFAHWNLCKLHPKINSSMVAIDFSELSISGDGSVVESFRIKHGDNVKWANLIDTISQGTLRPSLPSIKKNNISGVKEIIRDCTVSRDKHINKSPDLLYRHPLDLGELRTKLIIKASLPGVATSLGKGNPFIQAVASSIWSISTHCFSKVETNLETANGIQKRNKTFIKTSLLKDLVRCIKTNFPLNEFSKGKWNLLFPFGDRYSEATDVIRLYQGEKLYAPVHRIRHKRNVIPIQLKFIDVPLSLKQTATAIWFGFSVRVSRSVLKRCWAHYKNLFSWLEDTVEETITGSPFSNHIELYSFISSTESKSRVFKRYGPGIYAASFLGKLNQLVRKCYRSGYVTLTSNTPKFIRGSMKYQVCSQIGLALNIPFPETREQVVRGLLQSESISKIPVEDLATLPKREAIISIFSKFESASCSEDQMLTLIRRAKLGMIVAFTSPQRRIEGESGVKWEGEGECVVSYEGECMKLNLLDKTVKRVTVRDFKTLSNNVSILSEVFSELGASHDGKPSYSAGPCLAKFDGKRLTHKSTNGTPVYEDKELTPIGFDLSNMRMKISYKSMVLEGTHEGRSYKILGYYTRLSDMDLITCRTPSTDIWSSWVNQCPLHHNQAMALIKTIASKARKEGRDVTSPVILWARSTLIGRFEFRRVGSIPILYTDSIISGDEEEEDEEDFFEALFEEAQNMDNDDIVNILQEKWNLDDSDIGDQLMQDGDELEEGVITFLNNFMDVERPAISQVHRADRYNFLSMHPFWDGLIDEISLRSRTFITCILEGTIPVMNKELARDLMIILGKDPSRIESDSLQNYNGLEELDIN